MKNKKIVLIGMMGSGKTTVARLLSQKLAIQYFEADDIFELKHNITIKEYFSRFGEGEFRKQETKILKEVLSNNSFVFSSGGGVVLSEENRDLIFNDAITTIFLSASCETIYSRLKNDNTRPLLQVENLMNEIKKIMESRNNFYLLSKIQIQTDGKSVEQITEEIINKL